jgi:hypothetical protein
MIEHADGSRCTTRAGYAEEQLQAVKDLDRQHQAALQIRDKARRAVELRAIALRRAVCIENARVILGRPADSAPAATPRPRKKKVPRWARRS